MVPWSIVGAARVVYNSSTFNQQYLEYLRDCNHEWISHPLIGHYCQHCRLDMKDLEKILDPENTEVPALVIEDASLDQVSKSYDPERPVEEHIAVIDKTLPETAIEDLLKDPDEDDPSQGF